MDVKKGREVVAQYRSLLQFLPVGEGPFDTEPGPNEAMCHVRGMLDKMDGFLDSVPDRGGLPHDWVKFNRWLGFVQGCFWVQGIYTLNQMRDHNRA